MRSLKRSNKIQNTTTRKVQLLQDKKPQQQLEILQIII